MEYKIVEIAEFRARNNPDLPMTKFCIEHHPVYITKAYAEFRGDTIVENKMVQDRYYYRAQNGCLSTKYNSIRQAALDAIDLYGNWVDFKLLVII